ncbi:hypothetical protein HID58_016576 [Brassica napus]|uniref:Transmembrane protein n=1 Tax=Brassica napus TaxID=3708 RepID=A0ABQ8DNB0_BRANA|nr:hypothetical protein HID58_016576 [Brassica napus]
MQTLTLTSLAGYSRPQSIIFQTDLQSLEYYIFTSPEISWFSSTSTPKLSSSKPFKTQEVLWWGWGVFHSFLSISYMSISLFLGLGALWHWVGRLVYVFLVYLVLVLCWKKFGVFDVSCISRWICLIWTMRDLVFWNLKMDHVRSLQMWSLVSSNRRRPHRALVGFGHGGHQRVVGYRDSLGLGYGVQKLYGGCSRCFNGILYGIWKNNESQQMVGN